MFASEPFSFDLVSLWLTVLFILSVYSAETISEMTVSLFICTNDGEQNNSSSFASILSIFSAFRLSTACYRTTFPLIIISILFKSCQLLASGEKPVSIWV